MYAANLLLVLIIGLMSTAAHSMRFDLQSGATKCISEDIKSNAMTLGKYSVDNPHEGSPIPDTHKLTVRVCLISLSQNPFYINVMWFFVFVFLISFLVS